ncbi:dehydrogenase [Caulobacter sp. CCUG 60055]|uniref:SDR family NAD(P)-dependent oxidoreductase n=1 Tax=Caulobacter sp. CCUG 60055 TaxID=2100090 RepID=UPI001FA6EFC8|nr:SDR family oxidoreductase [Caulobacter sp. CCUG 60055]MBQ1543317.1 SDR family oxidoreductase [Caulobacteraceae bacterium]MCI3179785.1 dehydrogenase [Caulobacter sp. CCUG 60055]
MTRRLCLVTGASAGIGAAFARVYAQHGYDVALTARRADRLDRLADEIRLRYGVEAFSIAADLAQEDAVDVILQGVADHGRVVDALVNNAGYGLPGAYVSAGWSEQRALLRVLLDAPCELAHKVLPGMIERRFGRIVNVASLAGLIPGAAGQTLYGPAKAFLVKFSQGLHLETAAQGVHVTALCPGFTYSEFHDVNNTREDISRNTPSWLWLGADEVAAEGYEAAEANRAVCVTGSPNKAIAAAAKLIPDDWALALMASQGGRFRKV